jgi:lysophospholipase L1-like esterase
MRAASGLALVNVLSGFWTRAFVKRIAAWMAVVVIGACSAQAQGQEMIDDSGFTTAAEPAKLTGWRIDPAVGGSAVVKGEGETRVLTLTGERVVGPDGKQVHTGRLMQISRKPALPGRVYTISAEIRGEGQVMLGAIGFADRYSPVRVGMQGQTFELTPQWRKVSATFTPEDGAMCVSAFVQAYGWLQFASVRNISMTPVVQAGEIGLEASDFVFTRKQGATLSLKCGHAVKLLIYGPGGVPAGPGGPYGGSDAWIDHFYSAQPVPVGPAGAAHVKVAFAPDAREGFYRAVAVDMTTGQSATAYFCIYQDSTVQELRALAEKINLPTGTRIVFLGDSLTDFYRGRNYVDLVTRALARKNAQSATVINAGKAANNIGHIEARLTKDVVEQKPTHVFLFEGANDSKRHYSPTTGLGTRWAYPFEDYPKTYRAVVERIQKECRCKLVLMTTAPGDQRILEPFRKRAEIYGQAINFFCLEESVALAVKTQKEIAQSLGLPVIDVNAHFLGWMEKNAEQYLHVDDGVHISEEGNLQVALLVLRYLAQNDGKPPAKD